MTDLPSSADKSYFENLEEERLSPCAVKCSYAERFHIIPTEGRHFNYRTEFQRDRDRILHSRAFRRLIHKTQVYLYQESDHYRTRMAHTLEVTQLSRIIARALNLNEDLAEAIGLGHDLGQAPFGITGEEALIGLTSGEYSIEGIGDSLFRRIRPFNYALQSLRVVDELEKRYSYEGLNLTNFTREGIAKHGDYEVEGLTDTLRPGKPLFLEGQIVRRADIIATAAHNLEDGIRSGEIRLSSIEELEIGKEVIKNIGKTYRESRGSFLKENMMVRGIIHLLVTSTILRSREEINRWRKDNSVETSADFMKKMDALPPDLIGFSETVSERFRELRAFVEKAMANSNIVNRYQGKVKRVILELFRTYHENPLQLDDYFLIRYKNREGIGFLRDIPFRNIEEELDSHYRENPSFLSALCDHITGMTDIYALKEYNRLINFGYQDF